jgi:hypothetical protein
MSSRYKAMTIVLSEDLRIRDELLAEVVGLLRGPGEARRG